MLTLHDLSAPWKGQFIWNDLIEVWTSSFSMSSYGHTLAQVLTCFWLGALIHFSGFTWITIRFYWQSFICNWVLNCAVLLKEAGPTGLRQRFLSPLFMALAYSNIFCTSQTWSNMIKHENQGARKLHWILLCQLLPATILQHWLECPPTLGKHKPHASKGYGHKKQSVQVLSPKGPKDPERP